MKKIVEWRRSRCVVFTRAAPHFDNLFWMRAAIAISALLFACNTSGAIEVVVETDPMIAVDKVQLFVGLGYPQNPTGMPELLVPAEYKYPEQPTGFYWRRDINGENDIVEVAAGAADVHFVFHEGTFDRMTAIVVGYKSGTIVAAASLVDAYIEDGRVRQYHVKLKAASAAFPRPTLTPVTVHRWGPTNDTAQCVYLQDPANAEHPAIFIVDKKDPDCDGFEDSDDGVDVECRANVFMGATRPEREHTTCLRPDLLPGGESMMCVLGGPGCVDGRGATPGACDPSATCASPDHCLACATRADALACMAIRPASTATTTRIDCTFFMQDTGGSLSLCNGDAILSSRFQFLKTCDVDQKYWFWAIDADKWVEQSITKGGATFTAVPPTSDCGITLKVSGSLTAQALPPPTHSIINVRIPNGRSIALPFTLNFANQPTAGCDTKNECHLAGDLTPQPTLAACLQSAVVEPW
jgi:hypothetical protein